MGVLEGLNARILLERHNPWLVEEVSAVFLDGESKYLVDIDLVTAREQPESVNLSIVRLPLQDEASGVLILIEDISEEKRLQGTMRRFMSQSVVDQVLGRADDLMFGTACEASVLFADIRGFTSLAEKLTPRANDGVLDKFIGDAIMAVFGAPLSTGSDPQNAVSAGLEMLRMIGEISAARTARGQPPVRLGIGIASGEVVAGTIGSLKRMDYTVIGDSVNLASRLQDLTKTYGIEMLVDEATAKAVAPVNTLREIDRIIVRGRERPEKIFEVRNLAFENNQLLDAYASGRDSLARHDWCNAIAAFKRAMELDPTDEPSRLMLGRAKLLADNPPHSDWDGVWRAPVKV
jgi:adenylate cyclase